MPSTCTFELNKANGTYFGGENISGTVILTTTSEKKVRDISIIFLGEGKVQWIEQIAHRRAKGGTQHQSYMSHETYINNSSNVHGDGVLPAGTHTYTFNILLPLQCPTSCEGKFGHIRYELSLRLNRYYRFDNVFKRPLTIIKTIDLNLNPAYKIPCELATLKSLGFWPFSRGNINFTVTVPLSGYVCGQTVNYLLNVSNQSMNDAEGYLTELIKKITFTATKPLHKTRSSETVIFSQKCDEKCLRLTNRVIEGAFVLPAMSPSTITGGIICVEYRLKITLRLAGWSLNPKLEIPIVIGTLPITESIPIHSSSNSPTAPEISKTEFEGADNTVPPNYDQLNLPAYAEAVCSDSPFIDDDCKETNRIVDFKPLYPLYNFPINK